MKNKNERGFFDEQFRLERLASKEDPLTKLDKVIRWEDFRFIIENAFPKTDPKLGGRPAFDRVMMFKVLVLQSLYNISDANTEFQILDRLTFMRFLGLNLSDRVPDEKTIWLFREQLKDYRRRGRNLHGGHWRRGFGKNSSRHRRYGRQHGMDRSRGRKPEWRADRQRHNKVTDCRGRQSD